MIVCSCNIITRTEIEDAIAELLQQDMWSLITPGSVYHVLRKRGKCCGCFPQVVKIIVEVTRNLHLHQNTPSAFLETHLSTLSVEHDRCETMRKLAAMKRRHAA